MAHHSWNARNANLKGHIQPHIVLNVVFASMRYVAIYIEILLVLVRARIHFCTPLLVVAVVARVATLVCYVDIIVNVLVKRTRRTELIHSIQLILIFKYYVHINIIVVIVHIFIITTNSWITTVEFWGNVLERKHVYSSTYSTSSQQFIVFLHLSFSCITLPLSFEQLT